MFIDTSIKDQVLVAPKKREVKVEATAAATAMQAIRHESPIESGNGIDNGFAENEMESGDLLTKTTGKAKHKICPECGSETQIQEGCVS